MPPEMPKNKIWILVDLENAGPAFMRCVSAKSFKSDEHGLRLSSGTVVHHVRAQSDGSQAADNLISHKFIDLVKHYNNGSVSRIFVVSGVDKRYDALIAETAGTPITARHVYTKDCPDLQSLGRTHHFEVPPSKVDKVATSQKVEKRAPTPEITSSQGAIGEASTSISARQLHSLEQGNSSSPDVPHVLNVQPSSNQPGVPNYEAKTVQHYPIECPVCIKTCTKKLGRHVSLEHQDIASHLSKRLKRGDPKLLRDHISSMEDLPAR
ncbi:hypothetical protein HKX48_000334 [Thoreauomyces humboldtii]|nr:hypothetical protein HKX48_000334 [Thoreauomyces humboldtii]